MCSLNRAINMYKDEVKKCNCGSDKIYKMIRSVMNGKVSLEPICLKCYSELLNEDEK